MVESQIQNVVGKASVRHTHDFIYIKTLTHKANTVLFREENQDG